MTTQKELKKKYKKLPIHTNIIGEVGPFGLCEDGRDFVLVTKDGTVHGRLIGGQESLDKHHKGSFEVWAKAMLKSRKKTFTRQVERAMDMLTEAQVQLDLLEGLT